MAARIAFSRDEALATRQLLRQASVDPRKERKWWNAARKFVRKASTCGDKTLALQSWDLTALAAGWELPPWEYTEPKGQRGRFRFDGVPETLSWRALLAELDDDSFERVFQDGGVTKFEVVRSGTLGHHWCRDVPDFQLRVPTPARAFMMHVTSKGRINAIEQTLQEEPVGAGPDALAQATGRNRYHSDKASEGWDSFLHGGYDDREFRLHLDARGMPGGEDAAVVITPAPGFLVPGTPAAPWVAAPAQPPAATAAAWHPLDGCRVA